MWFALVFLVARRWQKKDKFCAPVSRRIHLLLYCTVRLFALALLFSLLEYGLTEPMVAGEGKGQSTDDHKNILIHIYMYDVYIYTWNVKASQHLTSVSLFCRWRLQWWSWCLLHPPEQSNQTDWNGTYTRNMLNVITHNRYVRNMMINSTISDIRRYLATTDVSKSYSL